MKTASFRGICISPLVILTIISCNLTAVEIRLWPLLRIEKPGAESEHGSNIDVLWPIFEIDTTRSEPAFAARPLVSYDGNEESGTFLFPIGWFGKDHLSLAPILWTAWGDNPHFLLAPVYGRWKGHETGFVIGPGLFLRSGNPERDIVGSLLPPILRIQSKDGSKNRQWILNYYQRRSRSRNGTALFPFFWWRSGERGGVQWQNREVYPFFGRRQESDAQGKKSLRIRILWPMAEITNHRDGSERNLLGYALQWGKDGHSQWHAVLPFYYLKQSDEKHNTFALPLLGFFSQTYGAAGKHQWLAWPFAGHRESPKSEEWNFLSGIVRYRESKSSADRKIAPLWPFAEWESAVELTRHRFWPLYRFTSKKDPESEKRFSAFAGLIGYQEGDRLDESLWFLLRPVTFQQSNSGEKHFRFLWKLIESHANKESRSWAVNPLFYSRTNENSKRWDFLGGLLGMKKQADQTSLRALWFLNFRLRERRQG